MICAGVALDRLSGGGGRADIHIFMFCLTSFF